MNTITAIFVVTISLSIIIAAVLAFFSQLTSQPRKKAEEREELDGSAYILADEELRRNIFNEIKEVVGSERVSKEISRRVASTFNKELDS